MNVQEYVRKYGIQKLIDTYHLRSNKHKNYQNLIQLCYYQLDTPKNEITDNCRGIILDTENNYEVVSFPFTRFTDYDFKNEKNNKINLSESRYLEKIDGSIITLYYYDNHWNVSTKGLPDASGSIKGLDISYNDYFWLVWNNLGYELPKDTNHCYMFEIKVLNDSFLVKHKNPDINLIGIRNLKTFKEVDIFDTELSMNWGVVKVFDFDSINDVKKFIYNVDPTTFEGFVAIDNEFNRVKIKSPQYEAINLIRCNNFINQEEWEKRKLQIHRENTIRFLDIARTNNHESFLDLEKYQSIREDFKFVKRKYKEFYNKLDNLLKTCKNLERKELGLKLQNNKELSGYVFAFNNGKFSDTRDIINSIDLKKLQYLVGL